MSGDGPRCLAAGTRPRVSRDDVSIWHTCKADQPSVFQFEDSSQLFARLGSQISEGETAELLDGQSFHWSISADARRRVDTNHGSLAGLLRRGFDGCARLRGCRRPHSH
jgi:hypothetical protein